jgi:hypothetical protein
MDVIDLPLAQIIPYRITRTAESMVGSSTMGKSLMVGRGIEGGGYCIRMNRTGDKDQGDRRRRRS